MKLRDVYQKLRSEHIVLLRTNGEAQKQLQSAEKQCSTHEEEVKVRLVTRLRMCTDGVPVMLCKDTGGQYLSTYYGD